MNSTISSNFFIVKIRSFYEVLRFREMIQNEISSKSISRNWKKIRLVLCFANWGKRSFVAALYLDDLQFKCIFQLKIRNRIQN
jgi:hypothetical protein